MEKTTNEPQVCYEPVDPDALQVAVETLECLGECFFGLPIHDKVMAERFLAAQFMDFEKKRRLRVVRPAEAI